MTMVPEERGSIAAAASAEKLVHGPISDKKCQKKVPKKIHKAEREKLKRDQLNDLFTDLGKMLEEDRQNNGKACILGDTTRILRDLLSQVESLQKENSILQNESHYVSMERNELRDENKVLRNEILELENEYRMRLAGNPIWGHGTTGLALPTPHSTGPIFTSQQPVQPTTITSAVFPLQQPLQQPTGIEQSYATPRQELRLFPEATPVEDCQPSEDQETPNYVTRPQPRYPTEAASWPVNLFPGLPRMEDDQCSSGTSCSSDEADTGRD